MKIILTYNPARRVWNGFFAGLPFVDSLATGDWTDKFEQRIAEIAEDRPEIIYFFAELSTA